MMQFENSPLNDNTVTPNMFLDTHPALFRIAPAIFGRSRRSRTARRGRVPRFITFRVDLTGTCAPETLGMIQGTVWEDQCVGPGPGTPVPDPLPVGVSARV